MLKHILFSSSLVIGVAGFATDYPVTSTDDSGPGTLRDAMNSIGAGDTITFDSMLSGTITLASALPALTIDTTIAGPDSLAVTIDGNAAYQIFEVNSNTVITNLVLTNNDTTTIGSAILVDDGAVLMLDTVSIPHCGGSCQAPVMVSAEAALLTNNVTFSSPSSSGVDITFDSDSAAIFGCDNSVQPQIWIATTGNSNMYKEGVGTMEIKAASSVDMALVADDGTLIFSDTTIEPVYALPSGILQGTSTSEYVANVGIVQTGSGFGTITNATDYYQDTSAVLNIKIDGSGNTDLVYAEATGHLAGDLVIQLAPGTYTASTEYTMMTCDAGFTTPFDNVYFDMGDGLEGISNASLSYTDTSVVLTITSTFNVSSHTALVAKKKCPPPEKKPSDSPVSKMFKKAFKHKKVPKENVCDVIKTYTKKMDKKAKKKKK